MQRPDHELLADLAAGPAAFEAFYRRHVRLVTSYAARRCARPEQAADVVAAVFLEVIDKAHRYDAERASRGTAVGWLLGIAATVVAGQRRADAREWLARQRVAGQRLLTVDDHAALEARIDAARLAPTLATALDALPAGERDLLELVGSEGLSVTEASRALGIAPAAGRMRLARARRKMRSALLAARHRRHQART